VLARPRLKSPEEGGEEWHQLTSEHFLLYTDLAIDSAQAQLEHFEVLRDALEQAAFPLSGGAEPHVAVVVFRHSRDYETLGPLQTSGVFYPLLPLDIERKPTLLVSGGLTELTQRRFVHEMVHELMQRAFGDTPPWLNEGLAEYFSTMSVEAGQVAFGAPVPERAGVPASALPTVSEITHADRSRFRAGDLYSTTAARYYAGSWMLVHLLRNGPETYRRRFDVLVRALSEGRAADEAWAMSIAGLPEETLERDFDAHATAPEWSIFGSKIAARPRSSLAVRAMRPAEVHWLWARAAPPTTAGTAVAAEQIDEAAALEPDSPETAYARGCLRRALGRHREASVEYRRAVTLAPNGVAEVEISRVPRVSGATRARTRFRWRCRRDKRSRGHRAGKLRGENPRSAQLGPFLSVAARR
jgi:hypothetical protein